MSAVAGLPQATINVSHAAAQGASAPEVAAGCAAEDCAGFDQVLAQQMDPPGSGPKSAGGREKTEDTEADDAPPVGGTEPTRTEPQPDHGLALALGLNPLLPLGTQVSTWARDSAARPTLDLPGNGLALGRRAHAMDTPAGNAIAKNRPATLPLTDEPPTSGTSSGPILPLEPMQQGPLSAELEPATGFTALGQVRAEAFAETGGAATPSTALPPNATAMLQATAATGPARLPEAAVATLHTPIGHPAWDQELGATLSWMASGKTQVAQLHLNPAELGPVTVTLTLQQDQASAQFFSAQPLVREAIEAALPRLREMLAEGGITLGQASVDARSAQHPSEQQARHQQAGRQASSASQPTSEPPTRTSTQPLRVALGRVDTFA